MKDFETFKATREKMDPSTRKNSKYQWEKAYEAYRSSRERVRKRSSKHDNRSSADRKNETLKSTERLEKEAVSKNCSLLNIKSELYGRTAYPGLRLAVTWIPAVSILITVIFFCINRLLNSNFLSDNISIEVLVLWVATLLTLGIIGRILIDIADSNLARLAIPSIDDLATSQKTSARVDNDLSNSGSD